MKTGAVSQRLMAPKNITQRVFLEGFNRDLFPWGVDLDWTPCILPTNKIRIKYVYLLYASCMLSFILKITATYRPTAWGVLTVFSA